MTRKTAKRAVSAARKATDKRVVGTAQNPSTIQGNLAGGAGATHLVNFTDRRVRGAGRPKKAS
jgi:hypothetical protein